MDPSVSIEAIPLRTVRPVDVESDDQTQSFSSPRTPPEVTLFRTVRPVIPADDVKAVHSTVPAKRGRGRPKGSKNSTSATKKPNADNPNSKAVTHCPNFDSEITKAERETGNQELADSVLMRFDAVRRRLCQLETGKAILITTLSNCSNLGVRTNTKKRIGPIPGVQVGDVFYYWGEMCLIGLHMQMVAGIDYLTAKDGATEGQLATSIVTSGHYHDITEELETLVYTGQGGNDQNRQPCDQKLERGNLALEASITRGNDVRVIRGIEDPNDKTNKKYIYDGLYTVTGSWKMTGVAGFQEFKFKLMRKLDQPPGYATWKSTISWRKFGLSDSRPEFIMEDLSYGREVSQVPLVNEIDENDKTTPERFTYITETLSANYTLDLTVDRQAVGCKSCRNRSCFSKDPNCGCIGKNDSVLPYHNQILVCRKPMVFECGYTCPCLADCKNRVIPNGLKIRLEVFKTENCGWGLRSWEPIRAGTFICEFAGVGKMKHEAEEDDEYLFDSSRVCKQFKWNYEPELVGEDPEKRISEVYNIPTQVLISAKKRGNVGRFMNHSCSPNIFWQPIDYERKFESYVRVGFFAMKHIPPLTELRYDYRVSGTTEQDGGDGGTFLGRKLCLCGSVACKGSFD